MSIRTAMHCDHSWCMASISLSPKWQPATSTALAKQLGWQVLLDPLTHYCPEHRLDKETDQ